MVAITDVTILKGSNQECVFSVHMRIYDFKIGPSILGVIQLILSVEED